MEVSVIIPVYNAEQYVSKAIDSALMQDEVIEVMLIEDNSPDNALKICEDYRDRDKRIVLLRHPNGENRGAGASRNLGIRHARAAYVAFLDADDQFVPNRFKPIQEIFAKHPDADGVYGHIGTLYYDEQYKSMHLQRMRSELTGMHNVVPPEELRDELLWGSRGHISVDSLVVKREILKGGMLFDETFRQAQDTDFMFRLSSAFRLYSLGDAVVVALRGVHGGNRVFQTEEAGIYHRQLLRKCIKNDFYQSKNRALAISMIKRYLKGSWINQTPLLSFLTTGMRMEIAFLLFKLSNPRVMLKLWTMQSR